MNVDRPTGNPNIESGAGLFAQLVKEEGSHVGGPAKEPEGVCRGGREEQVSKMGTMTEDCSPPPSYQGVRQQTHMNPEQCVHSYPAPAQLCGRTELSHSVWKPQGPKGLPPTVVRDLLNT